MVKVTTPVREVPPEVVGSSSLFFTKVLIVGRLTPAQLGRASIGSRGADSGFI